MIPKICSGCGDEVMAHLQAVNVFCKRCSQPASDRVHVVGYCDDCDENTIQYKNRVGWECDICGRLFVF